MTNTSYPLRCRGSGDFILDGGGILFAPSLFEVLLVPLTWEMVLTPKLAKKELQAFLIFLEFSSRRFSWTGLLWQDRPSKAGGWRRRSVANFYQLGPVLKHQLEGLSHHFTLTLMITLVRKNNDGSQMGRKRGALSSSLVWWYILYAESC